MIVHTLTADGPATVADCVRTVVCDRYDQPVAVFVETGDLFYLIKRGERGFEDAVRLTGIGRPAETLDLSFAGGR